MGSICCKNDDKYNLSSHSQNNKKNAKGPQTNKKERRSKKERRASLDLRDIRGLKLITKEELKRKYKFGKVLGAGSFGEVRLGLHRQFNKKVAVKIIRKDNLQDKPVYEDFMKNELSQL